MILSEDVTHNFLADVTIGQALLGLTTLVGIVTILWKITPITKQLSNLMDDWFGEKARPGVPQRKGVMERLSDQDEVIHQVADVVSKVEPIVDGSADGNHAEVLARLDLITEQVRSNAGHLTQVEQLLNRHVRESRAWINEVEKKTAEVDFEVPPWPDLPD